MALRTESIACTGEAHQSIYTYIHTFSMGEPTLELKGVRRHIIGEDMGNESSTRSYWHDTAWLEITHVGSGRDAGTCRSFDETRCARYSAHLSEKDEQHILSFLLYN
jgi:hypothetical protein